MAKTNSMINIRDLTYNIKGKNILNGISQDFMPGKINVIVGPNGSGKSTLLKIIGGEISDYAGIIEYNKIDIKKFGIKELSTMRAVLTQQTVLQFPLSVEELIMMGRYPHFDVNPSKEDKEICNEIITKLGLDKFRERNYLTLSGGEKQRVQFGRILAQIWSNDNTCNRYIFLDEPLNSLDIKYQKELLLQVKELLTPNTVVIAILHDVNLAIKYGDVLNFMKEGKIIAMGTPNEVLNIHLIKKVFDVDVEIIQHPYKTDEKIILI